MRPRLGAGWRTALLIALIALALTLATKAYRAVEPASPALKTPGLYRLVRHPMMLGLLTRAPARQRP